MLPVKLVSSIVLNSVGRRSNVQREWCHFSICEARWNLPPRIGGAGKSSHPSSSNSRALAVEKGHLDESTFAPTATPPTLAEPTTALRSGSDRRPLSSPPHNDRSLTHSEEHEEAVHAGDDCDATIKHLKPTPAGGVYHPAHRFRESLSALDTPIT